MSVRFLSRGSGLLTKFPLPFYVQACRQPNNVSRLFTPNTLTIARTFASKKHKNLLKQTKGFRGRSKNCFSVAIRRLQKSWQYAYRDRRRKRREWSKFWIQRIQAGVRQYSWRYSEFMGCYKQSGMKLDRKILAELAANEPFAFRSVVQVVEHTRKISKC
jgi:large subunit ribosomal protein L20